MDCDPVKALLASPTEWVRFNLGMENVVDAKFDDLSTISGSAMKFLTVNLKEEDGTVTHKRLVIKSSDEDGLESAKMLGRAREGLFLSHFSNQLNESIPQTYLALGDMQTGRKLLVTECLEAGVEAGQLFKWKSPHNTAEKLAEAMAKCQPPLAPRDLASRAFRIAANFHATFTGNESLVELDWLRGASWAKAALAKSDGVNGYPPVDPNWSALQQGAKDSWFRFKNEMKFGEVKMDKHVIACVETSLNKISWETFIDRIREHVKGDGTSVPPLTLVHGDFHPANMMWLPKEQQLKLFDFEMAGVGSGAQDLGQFTISHLDPTMRKEYEKELVKEYHAELQSALDQKTSGGIEGSQDVNSEAETGSNEDVDKRVVVQFDACWNEYVHGGIGRWIWFLCYLSDKMDAHWIQYFHDQVTAFLHDHFPDPDSVPQPRV